MDRVGTYAWERMTIVSVLLTGALVASAIAAAALLAPTENTMGHMQRVLYIHVTVAWLSLIGFVVMACSGIAYLARRDLRWDEWSRAACELGWACCGLTLVTGSLWARAAWNTWWTWDPRLMTTLILWGIYSTCLIVRGGSEDRHRSARVSAAMSILGLVDVPLIILAARWFRGIHPASPGMEPLMFGVLLFHAGSFLAFFALLLVYRRRQLGLENRLASLERLAYE